MATVYRNVKHSCSDCGGSTHKINEDAVQAMGQKLPKDLQGVTADRMIGEHLAKVSHDTGVGHTIASTHKSMMSGRNQSFTHGKDHN